MKRVKLIMILGFLAALGYAMHPSSVMAQTVETECTDGQDNDKDGKTDCDDSDCADKEECKVPTPKGVCHNIGGPDAKGGGANCDPNIVTQCCITTAELGQICVSNTQYFGIVISNSDKSAAAHIKHGDGFASRIFDPPLHLSSSGQNHLGANVECTADRQNEQDPEPGN